MKCLVTGAGGFIGRHLVCHLLNAGHEVRAVSSSEETLAETDDGLENVPMARSTLDPDVWQSACRGVEVAFHLAGRAHHGSDSSSSAQSLYFRDNVEMTRAVAHAALKAGARRFVFASSAVVYGAASLSGKAFRENSPAVPQPGDVYAQSKLAAEAFLLSDDICLNLNPVIIRLPLVYGAGVKGNMAALIRLAQSGLPLPLAGIDNRRSFIGISNCVDFLLAAATCADASGRVLLASDREDISTPDLIRVLARGLGKPARLFSVPSVLLEVACFLSGQGARFGKLAGNFQIDPAVSCALLGWSPKVSFMEGVAQMSAAYKRVCEKG